MKKFSLLILLMLFLIGLQACSLLIIEENTEEYKQLADQYNAYVTNDIIDYNDFEDMMNQASNVSATSVFMIESESLDFFNRVIKRAHGSGTIIYKDMDFFYVLITNQVIDNITKKVNYFVTDTYGVRLSATVFASDEILGVSLLKVTNGTNDYDIPSLATYMPLSNELVLMIANSYPTQNIHKLGFYFHEEDASYMSVSSSLSANGSPIFNLKLEVIGIQYIYDPLYIKMIDYEVIYNFISAQLPI